ncbi:MAG: TrkA C-terminal domain-containing protein [Candidatus Bathyarchaeia archaeon]|nr:PhoU family transcriptional regulator [Candidatus Bathyarchaeota archaeon]
MEELLKEIKEDFVELIEKAELSLDLAYSAIIFNNTEIAEDVLEVFESVNELYWKLQKNMLLLAKHLIKPEKLAPALVAIHNLREISKSTLLLSDLVLRGLPMHEVLNSIFTSSEETFIKVQVTSTGKLAGKTIKECGIQDNTGMRIICIKRGQAWIYGPTGDTRIEAGDILFAKGPIEGEEALKQLA